MCKKSSFSFTVFGELPEQRLTGWVYVTTTHSVPLRITCKFKKILFSRPRAFAIFFVSITPPFRAKKTEARGCFLPEEETVECFLLFLFFSFPLRLDRAISRLVSKNKPEKWRRIKPQFRRRSHDKNESTSVLLPFLLVYFYDFWSKKPI